jgi:RNA polymerase sigma factor for flagellar operon FliA
MADVARDLDVSLARVSQIRAEALELLRDGMNAQLDPDRVTPLPTTSRRVSRRAEYRATLAKVG